ncbi:MAG: diguanylate cyclase [Pseudomonadota bacterium]|nr:diguanylate cyclase [Pseudomonadota bacterium]
MTKLISTLLSLGGAMTRAALLLSVLTVSWLAAPLSASAQLLALDSALEGRYLGEYLSVWVDHDKNTPLRKVVQQQDWQAVGEAIPNFGHTAAVYWFRLDVQAAAESNSWLLVNSNPLTDYLDVYGVSEEGDVVSHYAGGSQRRSTEQDIRHRHNLIPVRMGEHSLLSYYIRVESQHSVQLPLTLWSLEGFLAWDEMTGVLTAAMLGSLFIMLLYNLFLYTTLRDPIYLAYIGSVFGFMMLQVSLKGFGLRFLWPNQFAVSSVAVFVSAYATIFFATTFASWFMQLKQRGFRFMIVLDITRWTALVCALLVHVLPEMMRMYLMVFLGISAVTMGIIAIFTYYRSDDRPIKIFTMGWIVLLIGALLFLMNRLGLVSVNVWTEQTLSVGSVLEMILFSMALGDRINSEKEQKLKAKAVLLHSLNAEREEKQRILLSEETARKAKEKTLQIRRDANQRLETEIEERTTELRQANEALSLMVQKDPLTGTYNRHHFNESMHGACRRASEARTELCLMMVDVDHFKRINDRYGHLAGDRCLIQVAGVLRSLVQGEGADIWRFGGEEFAVILEHSSLLQAQQLAEHMRASLEATSFADANGPRHITVSIGVAGLVPRPNQRPERLVDLADQALYAAKHSGRNKVCLFEREGGQHLA